MNVVGTISIKSICKYRNKKFWKENLSNEERELHNIITKESNGIILNINESLYIVTCYNHIRNYNKIYGIINIDGELNEMEIEEVGSIKPYDITLLKIKDLEFDNKMKRQLLTNLIDKRKNMQFDVKDIHGKNIFVQYDNNRQIECHHKISELNYMISSQYPKIPVIGITLGENVDDEIYEKIGGSMLCSTNNDVYGIVSQFNHETNYMSCIPSYCIHLFVELILSNNIISNILLETEVCDISVSDTNEINNTDVVGHYIKNNFDIMYGTMDNKKYKFNKGDILKSINQIKFNSDGSIHFRDMNMDVELETFITLSKSIYVDIEYYHTKNDKITLHSETIKKTHLESILMFSLEQNNDFIKYNGLIITEMSEELYSYFNGLGVHFVGLIECYYKNNNITNDNQRLVVIIDVDYTLNMDDENMKIYNLYSKIGLPFIKTKSNTSNDYFLSVITKFNDKKVINLECLKKLIEENTQEQGRIYKKNTMKVYVDKKKHYMLNF